MYQTAVSEVNFEDFGNRSRFLRQRDYPTALFVLAVAFNAVKSLFFDVDFDVDAVGHAADAQHRWREVCLEPGRRT